MGLYTARAGAGQQSLPLATSGTGNTVLLRLHVLCVLLACTDPSLPGLLVEPLYRKLVRWEVAVLSSAEDGPVALIPAELEQYSVLEELADADLALQEWQMMQVRDCLFLLCCERGVTSNPSHHPSDSTFATCVMCRVVHSAPTHAWSQQ